MQGSITLLVRGIVQGVGFRPFCARLALELGLGGWVRNTSEGVVINLVGEPSLFVVYRERLLSEAPPIAVIQSVALLENEGKEDPASSSSDFRILESQEQERQLVLIPPDIATCDACLLEMRDPSNRRYRYPFINCTNCGPRYTIIQKLPYDRPGTTMACFEMCPSCDEEYHNPSHRRFHAQPNACPKCGPHLWLLDAQGVELAQGERALDETIRCLKEGGIVAIKGLGGFHLACDAANDAAVTSLRGRKRRPDKPFAVMVRDLKTARLFAHVNETAERWLVSPRRPIVLCPVREGAPLSSAVAPRQGTLGIMLPYTPLHALLFDSLQILVMTSANKSEAPILSGNREAVKELKGVADRFLVHNRDIHMKIDDSVMAVLGRRSILIRRARGFVPNPLIMRKEMPSLFAAGAEMKAAFAFTNEHYLFPSQYLGDLQSLATLPFYKKAATHLLDLYRVSPRFLVCDLHPQYLSTRIAKEIVPHPEKTLFVQHHFAHLAACLAEKDCEDPCIGLILDGTGYGEDGTIWGGEILVGDATRYERKGSLLPARLPGGERAILEPWRYAYSLLFETYGQEKARDVAERLWSDKAPMLEKLEASRENGPLSSSCGRLFDAVSALLGIRSVISYDAQAAMELEATSAGIGETPFEYEWDTQGLLRIDWRPAIRWLVEKEELPVARRAASFHGGLARILTEACIEIGGREGIKKVALSGGVWQNRRLLTLTCTFLERSGFEVLSHEKLSPNDECVAVGQAWVGVHQLSGKGN